MTGRGDTHLGRRCGIGSLLTEGLEDFGAEILGSRDRATGAGFVAGGLDRAVGLRSGHGLTGSRGAFAHLPMGISGGSLLGSMTIRTAGTGDTSIVLADRTGFRPELAHLLSNLTAGEIGVGLTGHSCCAGGLLTSRFAMF